MGDSNVYTAERIINKRTVDGITQYYIKWKGYSNRDNTWEPADHILDPSLLTAFEKKEAKKSKRGPSNNSKAANSSPPAKTTNILNANSCDSLHRQSPSVINASPQFHLRQPIFDDSNNNTVSSSPRIINETSNSIVSDRPSVVPEHRTTLINNKPAAFQQTKRIDLISGSANKIGETSSSSSTIASGSKSITGVSSSSDSAHQDSGPTLSTPSSPIESSQISNFNTSQSATTATTTSTPVNSIKSKRTSSKFAILNTVITDVTVNDQTITISESKTNQGFFREVGRHSVAVDTANPGDCVNSVD